MKTASKLAEIFGKFCSVLKYRAIPMDNLWEEIIEGPKIPGTPTRSFPEEEVLGVPAAGYGYVTRGIRERHGLDKLQTQGLCGCLPVLGYNEEGAFLGHLNYYSDQAPKMFKQLSKVFEDRFRFCLPGIDELWEVAEEYASHIELLPVVPSKMGITFGGEIFRPGNNVRNDYVYREEIWGDNILLPGYIWGSPFYLSDEFDGLMCINDMEGII